MLQTAEESSHDSLTKESIRALHQEGSWAPREAADASTYSTSLCADQRPQIGGAFAKSIYANHSGTGQQTSGRPCPEAHNLQQQHKPCWVEVSGMWVQRYAHEEIRTCWTQDPVQCMWHAPTAVPAGSQARWSEEGASTVHSACRLTCGSLTSVSVQHKAIEILSESRHRTRASDNVPKLRPE